MSLLHEEPAFVQAELETLLSEYSDVAPVGSGGMGMVFRARHQSLGIHAVKVLLRSLLKETPSLMDRFRQEAQVLHQRMSSQVPIVYSHAINPDETSIIAAYMAMDYIDGPTLEVWRQEDRTFSDHLEIATQLAQALADVHSAGLIHRDIKHDNVLIDSSGRAWLCDFGLAYDPKATERHTVVRTGYVGTRLFSAPEVRAGRDADVRSDLYSLGVVLWELFNGGLFSPAVAQQSDLALSEFVVIPEALDNLLKRLVGTEPESRPETALELKEALELIRTSHDADGLPLAAKPDRSSLAQPVVPTDTTQVGEDSSPSNARRYLLGLAAITMALLVGASGLKSLSQRETTTEAVQDSVGLSSPSAKEALSGANEDDSVTDNISQAVTTETSRSAPTALTLAEVPTRGGDVDSPSLDSSSRDTQASLTPTIEPLTTYRLSVRIQNLDDATSSPEPLLQVTIGGKSPRQVRWAPKIQVSGHPGQSYHVVPIGLLWQLQSEVCTGTLGADSLITCRFDVSRSVGGIGSGHD